MVRPVWGFPHLESLILTSRYHLSHCLNQHPKNCWYSSLFCLLNAGLEVAIMEPDSLLFLPAFDCAPGAVFGAVGAWDKSSPTYRTAACGANAVQKRCFLGSTAYRNHLQISAPECHWGQTLQWGSSKSRQAPPSKLQHRFRIRDRT